MEFKLNETQAVIQDTTRRLLDKSFDGNAAREAEDSADGFSREIWQQICELGFGAAALPEAAGGGGFGVLELSILAEELGRAAASTPLAVNAGFSATVLQQVTQSSVTQDLLASLATSDAVVTPALSEPDGRDERSAPTIVFEETDDGGKVSGTKIMVPFASVASTFLVSLLSAEGEPLLVSVSADAAGITIQRHRVLGGDPMFQVEFAGVEVSVDSILARGDEAIRAIDLGLDAATLIATAEAVGYCEKMVLLGAEYAANREQFGKKIGSFQAVAHPLANMRIDTDACRLLVAETAWMLDEGRDVALDVAACKVFANEIVVSIIHAAHAAHGAIGYAMEYDLQLFSRRARSFCLSYGDTDSQTNRAAIALGL